MSSSLRGHPDSLWSLPRAVDALSEAGRQVAPPGFLWIAGIGYQFLNLGWSFGAIVGLPIAAKYFKMPSIGHGLIELRRVDLLAWVTENVLEGQRLWALLFITPLALVYFRLISGLARLSPAERWQAARGERRTPRLRAAWLAGKGTTFSALNLWLQFLLMMIVATVVFILPAQLLMKAVALETFFGGIITGLTIALMVLYGFVLSVIFQIALHSLVRNRRGVGSALLHAWRIAKNDAYATARAILVDAVLYTTVLGVIMAAGLVGALTNSGLIQVLLLPLWLCVEALAGGTRCAYWSRAYDALGGLSTVDDAPG